MLAFTLMQVCWVGIFEKHTRLNLAANQQHGCSRAVVGSLAAVFMSSPAEFRKGHHENPVLMATARHVLIEGGHGARWLGQQIGVVVWLVGVGVEILEPARDD